LEFGVLSSLKLKKRVFRRKPLSFQRGRGFFHGGKNVSGPGMEKFTVEKTIPRAESKFPPWKKAFRPQNGNFHRGKSDSGPGIQNFTVEKTFPRPEKKIPR
jgi:hypothetical protein